MASPLTSTTSRSSYLYGGIIIIFGLIFLYLWYLKDPTMKDSFNEQAFNMNAQALKNSVYLANVKFLSKSNSANYQDIWVENEVGLDFNTNGYPIGINSLNFDVNEPITIDNCKEVWIFFMGALQPLANGPSKTDYWAEIDVLGQCNYLSIQLPNKKIVYNATNGKVAINDR